MKIVRNSKGMGFSYKESFVSCVVLISIGFGNWGALGKPIDNSYADNPEKGIYGYEPPNDINGPETFNTKDKFNDLELQSLTDQIKTDSLYSNRPDDSNNQDTYSSGSDYRYSYSLSRYHYHSIWISVVALIIIIVRLYLCFSRIRNQRQMTAYSILVVEGIAQPPSGGRVENTTVEDSPPCYESVVQTADETKSVVSAPPATETKLAHHN